MQILNFLNGKKTYICALAWLGYKLAVYKQYIAPNSAIESALLAGGGISLRNAIANLQNQPQKTV